MPGRRSPEGGDLPALLLQRHPPDAGPMAAIPVHDLERAVLRSTAAVFAASGIAPSTTRCWTERHGPDLDVHLGVPASVDAALQRALAVRVLDAVGASGQRFGNVDVHIQGP